MISGFEEVGATGGRVEISRSDLLSSSHLDPKVPDSGDSEGLISRTEVPDMLMHEIKTTLVRHYLVKNNSKL